ncbi:MAG: shikimate dehydrogenase [Muribaculaceae bacterium]|nr:shikimate dehydrogenase [Muribaculaceae bacterium]
MNSGKKKIYGLIGYPLGHSFSKNYFNTKFEGEGINAVYVNFEIESVDLLRDVLAGNPNLSGLNVTIPYKEKVMPLLDDIDPVARKIGAVNVIKIIPEKSGRKRLVGYNSDIVGFSDSIAPMLGDAHRGALVLGTGGASKAIYTGLINLGLKPIYVSRTSRPGVITYADLTPEVMAQNKVIVNTTPVGMYPHVDEAPDIPYDLLTPEHICYDLIYNPDTTEFMRRAAARGAQTKNGLEMLLLQAFESWNIFCILYTSYAADD